MFERFSGKVVLVTGATSGMGRAVARRLAAEGAQVVLAARGKDSGEGFVAELKAAGHEELTLNLSSVFFGLKYQVPALQATGGGAIGNNASNLAVTGMAGMAAYSAAKHCVVGLTRSVALDTATTGVRVNALVTGGVDTPLLRRGLGPDPQQAVQAVGALHPVGRVAQPAEIAAFVAFLLSGESAFVTGAALAIDGGLTAA